MTDLADRNAVGRAVAKLAGPLAREVGDHKLVDDPDLLEALSGDESGLEPVLPHLALRVRSSDDVASALTLAAEHGVPVVARGGGTGKSGAAIPHLGGLVLDMSRLNQIVEIDRANLMVVAQPGVVTGDLQAAVEDEGLFYPPDPNSWETCQIGGNVSHNAGGPRAFKYGVTRNYVLGLETVLMGGERLRCGKLPIKGVAGYDLAGLMVGSEGTLGVFTEITLRLIVNPPRLATLLVRFGDELAAGRAVSRVVARGLVPRVLELMDGPMVETLRGAGASAVPEGTGALLLAELDGDSEERVEEDAIKLAELCEAEEASEVLMARHGGDRERLWAARRTLTDAVKARAAHKIAEDIAVPRAAAAELLEGLRRVGERHGVLVASYGHAGDGNFHVNVLWDDDDLDPTPAVDDVMRLALELGGTITGEHGIGLAKKRYLPWEKGEAHLQRLRAVKRVFDPQGLLNPGKVFD